MHCDGVAFSCKKYGESSTTLATQSSSSTIDRIRQIHGSQTANELIEFSSSEAKYGYTARGYTTNANYHVKKTTLLLFINHRSVESSNIRKAIEQTYSAFLPKGTHPFTYMSLEIDPHRVDVNVHPTKREVNFLNEDEIIEQICVDIRLKLATVDTSRAFKTQSLLPGARNPIELDDGSSPLKPTEQGGALNTPKPKPYENNLVRTDAKLRKITSMLTPSLSKDASIPETPSGAIGEEEYTQTPRSPITIRLSTVRELRTEVRDSMHTGLTEIFASHTFVGLVDERRRLAAIQSGVKLYLVDYGQICNEYFYQVGLTDFGNFGAINFSPPLDLREVIRIAAVQTKADLQPGETDFEIEDVVEMVTGQLIKSRDMLLEYFTMTVSEDGMLHSIPLLMKGYTPALSKLPRWLMRLGPFVNWTDEKECFKTFLRELALYYVPEQLPPPTEDEIAQLNSTLAPPASSSGSDSEQEISRQLAKRRAEITYAVEHVLFPAFRARLVATQGLLNGSVVEVANLKGLYRVFERC